MNRLLVSCRDAFGAAQCVPAVGAAQPDLPTAVIQPPPPWGRWGCRMHFCSLVSSIDATSSYQYHAMLHAKPLSLLPACPGATCISFAFRAAAATTWVLSLAKTTCNKGKMNPCIACGARQLWQPCVQCKGLCAGLGCGDGMQQGSVCVGCPCVSPISVPALRPEELPPSCSAG